MKIYVGNMPYGATEEELQDLFGEHGAVKDVQIIKDRETGRSKGFCFIEMPESGEAENAIEALNGSSMGGRTLTVNQARPRDNSNRRGPR